MSKYWNRFVCWIRGHKMVHWAMNFGYGNYGEFWTCDRCGYEERWQ